MPVIDGKMYTVRIVTLRVIAWAMIRESEGNAILLDPITLPLDPRENDGLYIQVADGNDNQSLNPMDVITVIPATATTQVWLRLQCDRQDVKQFDRVIEHPAGFFTQGAANNHEYEAWLEGQRARLEADCLDHFDWYFRTEEAIKDRKERGTRRNGMAVKRSVCAAITVSRTNF